MADVDWVRGAEGFKLWPQATKYKDYRQLLDKEKSIDAVTVVIPDHMHANVALAAMQRGKHVYVEKPLTRTPWEARVLTDAAAKYKVATQMGNQGYSHDATRVAAEIIWSGEIGDVTEVHSFRGRASWPQGMPDAAGSRESAGHPRLGSLARECRDATVFRRAMTPIARSTTSSSASTCRSTGAVSMTSAAASSATGASTSSGRRTWRCGSAARRASSASSRAKDEAPTPSRAAAS